MMNPWLLGLFAGLFGIGISEVNRFEREAARDILKQLEGDRKKVNIIVRYPGIASPAIGEVGEVLIKASGFKTEGIPLFTEPERSTAGTIQWLRLTLNDFSLKGLRIEQLKADIPDCRFDYQLALRKRQIRLSRSGIGTGSVKILAPDLAAFILKKYREIKRCTVAFDKDKVVVRGYGEFLVFNTDFEVIANLKSEAGKLYLDQAKIKFGDKEADTASQQALLNAVNPVVDLDEDLQLFGAITVDKIDIGNGALIASGPTRIPNKPAN